MKLLLGLALFFPLSAFSESLSDRQLDEMALEYVKIHNSAGTQGRLELALGFISKEGYARLPQDYKVKTIKKVFYDANTNTFTSAGHSMKVIDPLKGLFEMDGEQFQLPPSYPINNKRNGRSKSASVLRFLIPEANASDGVARSEEGCEEKNSWTYGTRGLRHVSRAHHLASDLAFTAWWMRTRVLAATQTCESLTSEIIEIVRGIHAPVREIECDSLHAVRFQLHATPNTSYEHNVYKGYTVIDGWYVHHSKLKGAAYEGRRMVVAEGKLVNRFSGKEYHHAEHSRLICSRENPHFNEAAEKYETYAPLFEFLTKNHYCYACKSHEAHKELNKKLIPSDGWVVPVLEKTQPKAI